MVTEPTTQRAGVSMQHRLADRDCNDGALALTAQRTRHHYRPAASFGGNRPRPARRVTAPHRVRRSIERSRMGAEGVCDARGTGGTGTALRPKPDGGSEGDRSRTHERAHRRIPGAGIDDTLCYVG